MSRLQLALNVDDLEAATAFYSRLFGVEPVIHDLVKHDGILNPEPEPRVLR